MGIVLSLLENNYVIMFGDRILYKMPYGLTFFECITMEVIISDVCYETDDHFVNWKPVH